MDRQVIETNENRTPDAAGAFELASDMEVFFQRIMQANAALVLIATTDGIDEETRLALIGLVQTVSDSLKNAEEMRGEMIYKLWAYGHPPAVQDTWIFERRERRSGG